MVILPLNIWVPKVEHINCPFSSHFQGQGREVSHMMNLPLHALYAHKGISSQDF